MPHPLTDTRNGSSDYHITSVQYGKYVRDVQANGVLPPYPIAILLSGDDVNPPKVVLIPHTMHELTNLKADGDDTYTMKVNENTVQELDDRVFSFEDGCTEEWVIIFRESERAYTIERKADSPKAWTTPLLPIQKVDHYLQIFLQPLHGDPPHSPDQLFKFDLVEA
ncbi:hypothetical protein F5J12DRAFT_891413 [Pisolithus orientalis]|uniref:uncharacterized protein n=1 Tax=Pisolithus orientalis TaxID=936130 RepID=UPI00222472C3|nr:uncharacterized protein F5J12DRAFT_891413 [Pisolithus orientalis]KAI6010908.1 hypothetical protein F5J12DRAFT_891413 [Pisolithus orientalis]